MERRLGSIEDLLETQRKELFQRVSEYDRNYQKQFQHLETLIS